MALPSLQSDHSPLDSGKFSTDEESWAGSLLSVGGVVGNFLFGSIVSKMMMKLQ